MGRNHAVTTGLARLTEAEHAWLAGDDARRPETRPIVTYIAFVLRTLYQHERLHDTVDYYERNFLAAVAMNLSEVIQTPSSRRPLAAQAARIADGNDYVERAWSDTLNGWAYRLTALGRRVSGDAWGEELDATIRAKATAAADTTTGEPTTDEGDTAL